MSVLFDLQAAMSAVFFLVMVAICYGGLLLVFLNSWLPARLVGGFLVLLAVAGFIGHIAALVRG